MKVMDIFACALAGAILFILAIIPFLLFGIGIALAILVVWAILKFAGVIAAGITMIYGAIL
jgi:hypothetical protein